MTTDLKGAPPEVEVVYSKRRARTASLRYTPRGNFILSVPLGSGDTWIAEFLRSRRAWMEKVRARVQNQSGSRRVHEGAHIQTPYYVLKVLGDPALKYPQYRVARNTKEKTSTFYLAPEFFLPENAEKLYTQLEKYLLAQMVKFGTPALIARAHYWADLHSIRVKEFFVRVQKSRLGYCTHDDRIMLNGRLLFAPQRLIDYVICHELAHTKHKNHSKSYWAYLEKLFPGARAADKALRDTTVYSMRPLPASPKSGGGESHDDFLPPSPRLGGRDGVRGEG